MQSFFGGLQRFGIGRLIAVLGAAAGAVAVLLGVMFNVGKQPDALLYSSLDPKEASEITAALGQAGVKYKVEGDGSMIMVQRDQVASARLLVAGKGLPTSGSVGYEIFDNTSVLGQTEFVQNLNKKRALEGELARTIRSLKGVSSAKVLLSIPERQLFQEEAAKPTASVVVGLNGHPLSADNVRALQNLVAGAVEGLKPDQVTVVDENNKLLAAASDQGDGAMTGMAADRKAEAEERVRRAIKDVIEGVVGPGKARVQVTADIDMARVTTQEEKFDPDGQVVRSTSTQAEKSSDGSSSSGGPASATGNLPGGTGDAAGGGTTNDANGETTNYEISKAVTTTVTEPGAVKRLSVAVAVDGISTVGKDGKVSYKARSPEEMQRIEQLVKSAMGFTEGRGDQVSVQNLRFDRDADVVGGVEAKPPLFDFDKNDIMRAVELVILAIVGILLIFFVLRPIMKSAGGAGGAAAGGFAPGQPALAGASGGGSPQLAYAGPGAADVNGGSLALPAPSEMDQRIDIARIEGQVKVSSIKKVADFVDKHPEESVSILRSWLHES